MLFKILHGDASRISTDITPFHEGYCYVTHDGYMYIDMNIGTKEAPNNQRIKLNAKEAEELVGFDPNNYQLKDDDTLETTDKTIIGAINEVNTKANVDEIYVGNGSMPEGATIQIIMDGSDEEQSLKDELKAYLDDLVATTYGNPVPPCTIANDGQILCVVDGMPAWSALPDAEEVTF
jgi:hypothetical protein